MTSIIIELFFNIDLNKYFYLFLDKKLNLLFFSFSQSPFAVALKLSLAPHVSQNSLIILDSEPHLVQTIGKDFLKTFHLRSIFSITSYVFFFFLLCCLKLNSFILRLNLLFILFLFVYIQNIDI